MSKIKLSEKESILVSFLADACAKSSPDTWPRIAGGWVRDKLLGSESYDIDIALNNMTGKSFLNVIRKEAKSKGIEWHEGHVVEARPEQSKHLETAGCKLFGIDVEFTNLRSEEYTDSRIPSMKFGTPREDAERRDSTINSLFYNIRADIIEDFTGNGIKDLYDKRIRTPLDPVKTFRDDPLRVLRTIRFASRLGFSVDREIRYAAKNADVQKDFLTKVSRERIWDEMIGHSNRHGGWKEGFLIGKDPLYALKLVCQFHFRDILFNPRDEELRNSLNSWDTDQNNKYHDLPIWGHTYLAFRYLLTRSNVIDNPVEKAVRHLALILHDLGKRDPNYRQLLEDGTYSYRAHEDRSAELAEVVLTDLCAPKDIKERIVRLCKEHQRFLHIAQGKPTDKAFRKIVRDVGDDWENLVDISEADGYGKKYKWNGTEVKEFFDMCRERIHKVLNEQQGETTPKRPLNGKDLIQIGFQPGPKMGELFRLLDEELLENPAMTKEEAIIFIQGQK